MSVSERKCPLCGATLQWYICSICDGDGEARDAEGLGHTPPCILCAGKGGYLSCPHDPAHLPIEMEIEGEAHG